VTRVICSLCNVKIIHSEETRHQLEVIHINSVNIKFLPLGGYIEYYPNEISLVEARRKMNIPEGNFVYIFFGRIEPYKGVLDLLETFKDLSLKDSSLIVAGPCDDQKLKDALKQYENFPDIKIITEYVPDQDIQIFLNSADVVVCPFKYITNSSTVLLAGSFGKAVIAPLIGNIKDLPEEIGLFYNPQKVSLSDVLGTAYSRRNVMRSKGKTAYDYIKSISWKDIADDLVKIYRSL